MASFKDRLEQAYRPNFKPRALGPSYSPAPKKDIFGRRQASPLEIQQAMEKQVFPSEPAHPKPKRPYRRHK